MRTHATYLRAAMGAVLLSATATVCGPALAADPDPGMTTETGKAGTGIHPAPQTSPGAEPLIKKVHKHHYHRHHHHKAARAAVKPG